MEDKKEAILKAVRLAVPESMDVKRGCIVEWGYDHSLNSRSSTWIVKKGIVLYAFTSSYQTRDMTLVHFERHKTAKIIDEKELTVLGRPLQLFDLLIALEKYAIAIDGMGTLLRINGPGKFSVVTHKEKGIDFLVATEYNLHKDLHQNLIDNPQLVSFLAEILL